MTAAGNRTLGFHSIKFINLPTRYDRLDAVTLQSYLSGIDIEEYPAVEAKMISDTGMPPTSNPQRLNRGEKGCWRAHANIWSEIIRKKLPPVLILESDVAWDINLRSIMGLFNKHFTRFLQQVGSRPLYQAGFSTSSNTGQHRPVGRPWRDHEGVKLERSRETYSAVTPNPDDPWHSEHWDLLFLGQCLDFQKKPGFYLKYSDPFVTAGKDYFGERLGHERVLHQSGGIACTTAYAITRRGAAKLLLRSAINLDSPVDLIM